MRTILIPGTQLASSRLGFGLSGLHHVLRSTARQNLLKTALEHGITYYDCSPYYGHGLAERELGRFARGRRDRILIATKTGIQPNPWFSRFPTLMYARLAASAALRRITKRKNFVVRAEHDYSAQNAIASVDRSLRALRTDHLDVLHVHDPTLDRLQEPDQLFDALRALQSSGKVRHIGLAGNAIECLAILQKHHALRCLLQVDGSHAGDLALLHSRAVEFQCSYGHFRNREAPLGDLLGAAVAGNPRGVILFSTRRVEHLRTMVDVLARLESA